MNRRTLSLPISPSFCLRQKSPGGGGGSAPSFVQLRGEHGREVARSIMYDAYGVWGYVREVWVCVSSVLWVESGEGGRVEYIKVVVTCEHIYLCII